MREHKIESVLEFTSLMVRWEWRNQLTTLCHMLAAPAPPQRGSLSPDISGHPNS